MDERQFDRFIRSLGAGASRRSALGGLLALRLLELASAGSKKGKGRGGRGASRHGKDAARVGAEATCGSPGPSRNLNGCNFDNDDLSGIDLSSSSMRGTSFRGADLCGADLSSSQLKNADFRGFAKPGNATNLVRADLSSSGCTGTRFNARTLFCNTKMCTGAINSRDCPPGVDPGSVCCTDVDCGPGSVCQRGVCCTTDLAAAVSAASPGNTIRVCPGTFQTRDVVLDRNLTLVGAGAEATILGAEGVNRVLQVGSGAVVELRDLTITGGDLEFNGGGIFNRGTLTLRRTTVRDNRTTQGGGGIFNTQSGTVTLESGTVIAGNRARLFGGGVMNDRGILTLRDGSAVGSNASFGPGGGVFTSHPGTTTLEAGATVSGNSPDNCEPTIGTCS